MSNLDSGIQAERRMKYSMPTLSVFGSAVELTAAGSGFAEPEPVGTFAYGDGNSGPYCASSSPWVTTGGCTARNRP